MKEFSIAALVWDDFNEAHIWERHQLTRLQVEEVCYGDASNIHLKTTFGGRLLLVGPGQDGKLYAIVLASEGENIFYPVSARRASKKERSEYAAWQAGTQHE